MRFTGEVQKIHYYRNDWGVFTLKTEDKKNHLLKVCGVFLELHAGSFLEVEGDFEDHPKYGMSFKAKSSVLRVPSTLDGLKRYLVSVLPGVGVSLAGVIVDKFGENTVDVLSNTPDKLHEVEGLSRIDIQQISEAWQKDHQNREIIIFLAQFGLSRLMCDRIIDRYGPDTIQVVSQDPYILTSIAGLGFIKVDRVALKMGIDPNGTLRRRSAVTYVLEEAAQDEGHTYLEVPELCSRLLRLNLEGMNKSTWTIDEVVDFLQELRDQNRGVLDDGKAYLPSLHHFEMESARILMDLLESPISHDQWGDGFAESSFLHSGQQEEVDRSGLEDGCLLSEPLLVKFIEDYQKSEGVEFSEEQIAAIALANKSRVLLVTGLPGTGKTTVMKALTKLFGKTGHYTELCAPTGKAAKRMTEVSGKSAQTIHRLLGYQGKSWEYNRGNRLPARFVIVDEFSMVDIGLFYRLVSSLEDHAHLVMVGDPAQLPSVGPGYVLHNLKESGKIPYVHLTKIFRQAEKSDIIKSAHLIHRGEMIVGGGTSSDFNVYRHTDEGLLFKALVDVVKGLIQKGRPVDAFQVLAPMKMGKLGIENLNKVLRPIISPVTVHSSRVSYGDLEFAVGDRVMVTKNNYDKGVFNGESGIVVSVVAEDRKVKVMIDNNEVEFSGKELETLTYAYALTIHKSQGSEWPMVLIPLCLGHGRMLERNLLYTGVTRAKGRLLLFCQEAALVKAITIHRAIQRNTSLAQFLTRGDLPEESSLDPDEL